MKFHMESVFCCCRELFLRAGNDCGIVWTSGPARCHGENLEFIHASPTKMSGRWENDRRGVDNGGSVGESKQCIVLLMLKYATSTHFHALKPAHGSAAAFCPCP